MNPPSDPTVAYYDAQAEQYALETRTAEMGRLYEPFLKLVPSGGHILDAGCGSGRDALAFRRLGYRVTAFDASPVLCKMAEDLIGQSVSVLRFQEVAFREEFDSIWACAS